MKTIYWQRIESLYEAAVALDAAERHRFLQRECSDDDKLQTEILSLLTAHDEATGFLEAPVPLVRQHMRIGASIEQYRVLSVLGVGGMGEVFLAEDTRLHRQVALKLLPAHFSQNSQRIHRFEQEARATTALNHPNIVTLHDTGQHADAYYIVTEFVDGRTLREILNQREALPVGEALNLAQQIAQALAAAQAANIVHRDIKPENVMVRRDGFVKVLDFGLAKLADVTAETPLAQDETHEDVTPPSLTAAGALLGTVRYMSPEQARGETVDARTDVFSLGVVLYEMLAGTHPFEYATATQTMAAILETEPAALPKAIPVALSSLVTSALHKNRDERVATAEEFAARLQQINNELQFSVRLASEPWWRGWWRRWPTWVGATVLALTAFFIWKQSQNNFDATVLSQLKFTPVDSWKAEETSNGAVVNL